MEKKDEKVEKRKKGLDVERNKNIGRKQTAKRG